MKNLLQNTTQLAQAIWGHMRLSTRPAAEETIRYG